MKGYLDNDRANEAAFAGGWFHTGDLAVLHPIRYVEIKDRSKDIVISGGENVSTLEWRRCLYRILPCSKRRSSRGRTRNGARCRMRS